MRNLDDMLFDDWVELNKRDPEEFEACRNQAIALCIGRSTPNQAEINRELQHEIDWVIRSAASTHEVQEKLQSMLLDHFEFMVESVEYMKMNLVKSRHLTKKSE